MDNSTARPYPLYLDRFYIHWMMLKVILELKSSLLIPWPLLHCSIYKKYILNFSFPITGLTFQVRKVIGGGVVGFGGL